MPRSMWKGAISFGLVHIPVDMYPAVDNKGLDLTMLDRRDFSPVGFKRYNKSNGKEVSWDDIVKGYEYTSGEYVVLSDEDLRRANPEATQTIDIVAFVDAEDVSLLYFEQPYYLAPGKGGDKVYALLRETLRRAGKIGIARVVIRVKQHLAALVCVGDTIVMNTLRYADEIRDAGDLKIPAKNDRKVAVTDKELKMAMALVQGMAEDWDPEQYHDTYREDVLALIEKKVKAHQTKTITMPEPGEQKRETGKVIDLVSLLQASLGKKPSKAASADDDDDDDEPPPKKRRPAAEEDEDEEEAPPPRRKTAAHGSDRVAASGAAPKRKTATKAAAKPTAKPAARKTAAKSTTAPARRRKAA
ncbi:non-homologous end joining protein Ku [Massilia agri]|uniref:Non-homologous end joining protein Ku n=1 Tax=Massilia agri TaxID=1886785 RepID=A0ABT2AQ52_9BURK|nr:Ku protein [Massilia agri]MCS0598356.1 Ku protein [Massilia agri]